MKVKILSYNLQTFYFSENTECRSMINSNISDHIGTDTTGPFYNETTKVLEIAV